MSITELLSILEGAEVKLVVRFADNEMEVDMDRQLNPVYCHATHWIGGSGRGIESVNDAVDTEAALLAYLKACGINLEAAKSVTS